MIYLGIDNGISGAMVALSDHPGPPIDMTVMPTTGVARGNEVDAKAFLDWIDKYDVGNMTVIVEVPGKFSKGSMSLTSMWNSFGKICGVLEAYSVRHVRITPQSWQKFLLAGCVKGDTKPHALRKARQLWPDEQWLSTPRCKVSHDGLVDAALIAEYGRMKSL